MVVEKNQLIPTERAIAVIEHLRRHYPMLVNPMVTAQWERKLAQMAKGECEREQFMEEIEWAVRELVQILQTHKMPFLDLSGVKQAQTFVCPCCSGSLKDKGKLLECDCGFKLWKTITGKTLTDKQIHVLIENGHTDEIKGFVGKSGKSFNAKLKIDRENKQVKFEFTN